MAGNDMTVYTPDSSARHPARMLAAMMRDLFACRELARRFAIRDIRAQYRQTLLGLTWAFILPLANTAVWIFLNRSGIVNISDTPLPYPVYVFSGTMVWAVFMDAVNAPLQQTISAKSILTKVNFPREALVMSGVYQGLFNGVIKIAVLLPVLFLLGVYPGWSLMLLPVGILSLILAGTAFGLLLTPVGVLYADIGKILPLLMQFLMYFTPVVFPMPETGWAAVVFKINPATPLILTTRNWLTGTTPGYLGLFFLVNLGVIAVLLLVWIVFRLAMPILIERMNA